MAMQKYICCMAERGGLVMATLVEAAASTEDGKHTETEVIRWCVLELPEGLGVGWLYLRCIYVWI